MKHRPAGWLRWPVLLAAVFVSACDVTLDAGTDHPHGKLPVDERNPILLVNDGPHDNWQGEYALLLAKANRKPLAGVVVGSSTAWPDLEANVTGWRKLLAAAQASGLGDAPALTASMGPPLVKPDNGDVESTIPNRSAGAQAIVEASSRIATAHRPLVVVTGARLTDVADAYLLDPGVAERTFVVSSLGTVTSPGGAMGMPNGEMDSWADAIVASRFRYIQVSAYYDQLTDIPTALLPMLPANDFGAWIAAKQPQLLDLPQASDQVAAIAVALPAFVQEVATMNADLSTVGTGSGPNLVADAAGRALLVTHGASGLATAGFRKLLLDPATFAR